MGITNLTTLVESTGNTTGNWTPTFFPYAGTPVQPTNTVPAGANITLVTTGTNVATLGATAVANLGLINGATYVVFGIGSYTTMSGKTVDDVPVHFDDNPLYSPTKAYARFGVVFQVADSNGTRCLRRSMAAPSRFTTRATAVWWGPMLILPSTSTTSARTTNDDESMAMRTTGPSCGRKPATGWSVLNRTGGETGLIDQDAVVFRQGEAGAYSSASAGALVRAPG